MATDEQKGSTPEPPRTQDVAGSRSTIARVAELLSTDARFSAFSINRPHPLLVMVRDKERFVLVAPSDVWDRGRDLLRPFSGKATEGEAALVLVGCPQDPDLDQAISRGLVALVAEDGKAEDFLVAIKTAFELMEARGRAESRGKWLNRYRYELGELIEISRALTTEREIDKLLGLILEKSRFITGADAGSIYVVEGDDPDPARRTLRFKLTQNDSVKFDSREFTIPISARSISGSAALSRKIINIADVYDLPAGSPFSFDHRFDEKIGYRTRSMLTAPLIDKEGEVIGVLQLINKKRDPKTILRAREHVDDEVIPFDDRSEELLSTLAANAGIALENALLYAEIKSLFEGFVKASVEAIEQRDPTTSGHSRRVADLTVHLARAVEREELGPYRDVVWSVGDLRELEFASLLHDFGKIGVREQVLVKAKKLYPGEFDAIRQRFDFVYRGVEIDILRRKMRAVERGAGVDDLAVYDEELERRRRELEEMWTTILSANEPTILKGGDFARIEAIARETYVDLKGNVLPLLTPEELSSLSVAKGSLTNGEIDEIRSHVVHTYNFLKTIPWGSAFHRVPLIAGAHHERLNGTGYPNHLRAEQIPLQSKMMSISDIFDALTASDRPYKKAVPVDRALDILAFEVKDGHVDGELVRIFRDAKVWEPVMSNAG
jgi:HD-GYP domain-containing protein (c-di-GMP phosphodiesterase class II)